NRVGSSTGQLNRTPGLPAGTVPVTTTMCEPSGAVLSDAQLMLGTESATLVVAWFTNRTYRVSGETCSATASPGVVPGATVTSTTLSLTTMGEITTPVPSSRSPSGKSEASMITL